MRRIVRATRSEAHGSEGSMEKDSCISEPMTTFLRSVRVSSHASTLPPFTIAPPRIVQGIYFAWVNSVLYMIALYSCFNPSP
ncbi:hypothetical protein PHLGIDRAFT_24796 [Phlebiopsis gigantea 11061_1 CR5-6]|uniref:Uncharacterized protein n=1 Tax=Phlebiopsis gigantea (strain 11061_1 CR5-6) TaxID=745531 RepID=A0A0C3S665_PHLG1|nr:hypothetical protein PHLGIDRAFT_24796 [Phlebiopsis gigantea 11061_1 CR5-6]